MQSPKHYIAIGMFHTGVMHDEKPALVLNPESRALAGGRYRRLPTNQIGGECMYPVALTRVLSDVDHGMSSEPTSRTAC